MILLVNILMNNNSYKKVFHPRKIKKMKKGEGEYFSIQLALS